MLEYKSAMGEPEPAHFSGNTELRYRLIPRQMLPVSNHCFVFLGIHAVVTLVFWQLSKFCSTHHIIAWLTSFVFSKTQVDSLQVTSPLHSAVPDV